MKLLENVPLILIFLICRIYVRMDFEAVAFRKQTPLYNICNICFWEASSNIHDNGVLIVID